MTCDGVRHALGDQDQCDYEGLSESQVDVRRTRRIPVIPAIRSPVNQVKSRG